MTNSMKTPVVIWMRRDLRLIDNPAVNQAVKQAKTENRDLIIIRDSISTLGNIPLHPVRQSYENRVFDQIARDAPSLGASVVDGNKSGASVIDICAARNVGVLHSCEEWGDHKSWQEERRLKSRAAALNIIWHDHSHGGISRGTTPKPATGFIGVPEHIKIEHQPLIKPLKAFLNTKLPRNHYARDQWRADIGQDVSSRFSIGLSCGAIASERVIWEAHHAMGNASNRLPYQQFLARLSWRQDFIQDFEGDTSFYPDVRNLPSWWHDQEAWERSLPAYTNLPWGQFPAYQRLERWIGGHTGVPIIDAAMRCLNNRGWVSFRLRQTLASFAIDLLDLDWRLVLVALGLRFADYTPGIHFPQMALQAGMRFPERGPRIVNPIKQAQQLDPEELFVRRWLPELQFIQQGFGHEPWKAPGASYGLPIVDVTTAMKVARALWPKKHGSEDGRIAHQGEQKQMSFL